jgi:uncharacterized tellurite resistance protein B-like protein
MYRGIYGYNILSILSKADNKFDPNEDIVIRNWLIQEFDFTKNLDEQVEILSNLKKSEYEAFFIQQLDLFYTVSTQTQRLNLLQFAMNLIKADGKIKKGEHQYFDLMFSHWNEGE